MRHLLFIVMTFFLLIILPSQVVATTTPETTFETEPLPAETQSMIISNINLTLLSEEPKKSAIVCFDVNDNAMFAIGSYETMKSRVCVYSSCGVFQYGYEFIYSGEFGIELDDNSLLIYTKKNDFVYSVNPTGDIQQVAQIKSTKTNRTYWNEILYKKAQAIGNIQYVIRNNMGVFNIFSLSYSQLVKITSDGEETIIYDASGIHHYNTIIGVVCVLGFVGIAVFVRKTGVGSEQ